MVYLFVVDLIFLFLNTIIMPLLIFYSMMVCKPKLIERFNECIDAIYKRLFGMQKLDVAGFRRLRTSSQLTFESLPQLILQIRIFFYLKDSPEELADLDVSLETIMVSILFALLHAAIEAIFINLEKKANKTTMMHYLIICFNGRFGYVPFKQYFNLDK